MWPADEGARAQLAVVAADFVSHDQLLPAAGLRLHKEHDACGLQAKVAKSITHNTRVIVVAAVVVV